MSKVPRKKVGLNVQELLQNAAAKAVEQAGRSILDMQERARQMGALDLHEVIRRSGVDVIGQAHRNFLEVQEQFNKWEKLHLVEMTQNSAARVFEQVARSILDMQERARQMGALDLQEVIRRSGVDVIGQAHRNFLDMQEQLSKSGALHLAEMMRKSTARAIEQVGRDFQDIQEKARRMGTLSFQDVLRHSRNDVLEQASRSILEMQRQLKGITLPGIESAFKTLSAEKQLLEISQIHGLADRVSQLIGSFEEEEFDDDFLRVGVDGTLTFQGETVTGTEVEKAFQDFFQHIRDHLHDFRARQLPQQKPIRALLRWFVSTVIIPILITLYFQRQASDELLEIRRRIELRIELEAIKTRREFIAAIKKFHSREIVVKTNFLRVVIGQRVQIYSHPNRSVTNKGTIPMGTIVRLIERRRRWTAIEYVDPNTLTLERGWVFNKYLRHVDW